ncbi:MAG: PEP-CTERM sorting domain-containing protein [Candidatus Brocadiae bacterium]|nr:PEP-CTERM sorting domain-containing protein [Candidatus Brocadiia bacterium]
MRKIFLTIVVALLAISLAAPPASAVDLGIGENLAKLKDVSDLWFDHDNDLSTPSVLRIGNTGMPPVVGEEQRTLFQVTTIFDEGGGVVFDTSDPTELTGLLYDLVLAGPPTPYGSGFILDFVPYGRNPLLVDADGDTIGAVDPTTGAPIVFGGVMEVYEDAAKDYTQDPGGVGAWDAILPTAPAPPLPVPSLYPAGAGPSFWTEGASGVGHAGAVGADAFPGATEGTYWLSAAFIELQYLANMGVLIDPALIPGGIPFAAGTVLREFVDLSAGSGHGFAYANIFGGAMASMFERGTGGPLADLALLFNVDGPIVVPIPGGGMGLYDTLVYQGLGYWLIDSEDPVVFGIIPEPATLSLLGLSLLGLAGIRLRRKK